MKITRERHFTKQSNWNANENDDKKCDCVSETSEIDSKAKFGSDQLLEMKILIVLNKGKYSLLPHWSRHANTDHGGMANATKRSLDCVLCEDTTYIAPGQKNGKPHPRLEAKR